jgi:hypothetical protein
MNAEELKERAKKRARANRRRRKKPGFERVMGRLIAAGFLRANEGYAQKYHGKVTLADALQAGELEPRVFELLPAIVLKKPAFFEETDEMPDDLAHVLQAIRRGEATEPFRGIPAPDYLAWVPRIGHKGKVPTLPKTFRFRQDDLTLLRDLAGELATTETDVIRRGLKALGREYGH